MRLVVVIPTYNEATNLPLLARALMALPLPGVNLGLLVIDDDSPDGTGRIADELAREHPGRLEVLHRRVKQGLGRAYIDGFIRALAARPDLIAHMDADLSHDPAYLPAMIEAIDAADLVIGSRYADGGSVDPAWSWRRKALSWSANRIAVPALLGVAARDATSGYRLWRHAALAKVDPAARVRSDGYGFLVEMAFLATRLGCRIKEVPIHFRDRSQGKSKMTPRVQLEAIREIVSIRLRHRRLRSPPQVEGR